MSIAPGVRLGPYEILSPLGAGGMGEVWRAKDVRIEREVALKVLPEEFFESEEKRQRFGREARMLASLNHPGIATLYSFEEIPGSSSSPSRHLLAMELVDGQSLSRRLQAGAIPMGRALSIGRDIAAALEAAHAKGIVHRDLKPSNVMLSSEGRVKLLDFGLAKVCEASEATPDPAHAPTLTAAGTGGGLLGTAAYMSPEQARGQRVDSRTDVWAFGVVLWEMLTGQRLFRGQSTPDTLAAVLREPVDSKRLPLGTPAEVRDLLARCLERDPLRRLADAGDVRRVLEQVVAGGTSRRFPGLALSLASVVLVVLAVGGTFVARSRAPAPAASASSAPSIAVLPFTNLGGDRDQEYFSDGLSEQVMGLLTHVKDLKVAGRTSSFSFKGKSEDLSTIGRKLNVATVLEGSVQRVGGRLRVSTRLVSVADGYQLWAETYDRQMTDSFALQDEIAGAVVAALQVKLAGRNPRPRLRIPDAGAYAQYLIAHSLFMSAKFDELPRIVTTLESVIRTDPDFAPAYADLSRVEAALAEGNEDLSVTAEHIRRARKLADQAVGVDPESPEGYLARVQVHRWEWNWDAAEADLARAFALNPGGSRELWERGQLLTTRGRLREAIEAYRAVVQTDPLAPGGWVCLAQRLVHDGDAKAAGEAAGRAVALLPGHADAHFETGLASLVGGDARAALAEFERATGRRSLGVAMAQHTLGHPKEARDALDEYIAKHGNARPYWIAVAQAWLGDRENAFDWLERARARKDGYVTWIKSDLAFFRGLRDDPRYTALLKKLNLPGD